jgi:hypothetical protein
MIRRLVLPIFMLAMLCGFSVLVNADTTPAPQPSQVDVNELASEVDVLQLITELKLDAKQIEFISRQLDSTKQKWVDGKKTESAVLAEAQDSLQKIRDSLVAGKPIPASAETTAGNKLNQLRKIRAQLDRNFQTAVKSCAAIVNEGQRRWVARSVEATQSAAQLVQKIRNAGDDEWPTTLSAITDQLLKVSEVDIQNDWQAQADRLQTLPQDERNSALKDLNTQKEASISKARDEIQQLLTDTRNVPSEQLPNAVARIAVKLRSAADVQAQIEDIMTRILDGVGAPAALSAKLEGMKAAEAKKQ